jgi:hypothetical protein
MGDFNQFLSQFSARTGAHQVHRVVDRLAGRAKTTRSGFITRVLAL